MSKCPQTIFYEAVERGDATQVDYAFSELAEASRLGHDFGYGSYEFFGGSVVGAVIRYLIKYGDVRDIAKLFKFVRDCRAIRSDCAEGIDFECPIYQELWVSCLLNSSDEDRITMIQDVDISTSEGDSVEQLLNSISRELLSSKEAKMIKDTLAGKHYA